jgi:hypothetical protein
MNEIANRRAFLERANTLVRKSQPDLNDLSQVCESLADVMTDIIGAPCRIVIKCDAKQLDKAIQIAEAAGKAGAQ